LHEGYEEAARQSAGAAAAPIQPPSVLANRNKPGCRLHESGSSNSPEGNFYGMRHMSDFDTQYYDKKDIAIKRHFSSNISITDYCV
jgi:hypothetical protein